MLKVAFNQKRDFKFMATKWRQIMIFDVTKYYKVAYFLEIRQTVSTCVVNRIGTQIINLVA